MIRTHRLLPSVAFALGSFVCTAGPASADAVADFFTALPSGSTRLPALSSSCPTIPVNSTPRALQGCAASARTGTIRRRYRFRPN